MAINKPPTELNTNDFSDVMLWFYGGHLGAKRNAILGYNSEDYSKAPNKPMSYDSMIAILEEIRKDIGPILILENNVINGLIALGKLLKNNDYNGANLLIDKAIVDGTFAPASIKSSIQDTKDLKTPQLILTNIYTDYSIKNIITVPKLKEKLDSIDKKTFDRLYLQSNIDVLLFNYFYSGAPKDELEHETLSKEYIYFVIHSGKAHRALQTAEFSRNVLESFFSKMNNSALTFLDTFLNLLENGDPTKGFSIKNYNSLQGTSYKFNFKKITVVNAPPSPLPMAPDDKTKYTIYMTTIPYVPIKTVNPIDGTLIRNSGYLQDLYYRAYMTELIIPETNWYNEMATKIPFKEANLTFKSGAAAIPTDFTVPIIYNYFNLNFPRVLTYLAQAQPIMASSLNRLPPVSKNLSGVIYDITGVDTLFSDGTSLPAVSKEVCTGQYEQECNDLLACIMNNKSDDLLNCLKYVEDKAFWGDMENIILRDTTKLHGLMLKLQIRFNKSTGEVENYNQWLDRQGGKWNGYPYFLTMVMEIMAIARRVNPNRKASTVNQVAANYGDVINAIKNIDKNELKQPVGAPSGQFVPYINNDTSKPYLNLILPNFGVSGQPQVYNSGMVDPQTMAIQSNLRNMVTNAIMESNRMNMFNSVYNKYPFRPPVMIGMGMSGGDATKPVQQTIEDLVYNSNIKSNDPIFNTLLRQSHKEIILGIFNIKRKVQALFAEMKRLNINYKPEEEKAVLEYYDKLIEGETRGTKLLLYMRAYIELSKLFPNSNNDENTRLNFNLGDLKADTLGSEQEVAAFIKKNMEALYDKYTSNATGVYGVELKTQNYLQQLLANLSSPSGNMTTFAPGKYPEVK